MVSSNDFYLIIVVFAHCYMVTHNNLGKKNVHLQIMYI